jgi:pyruvate/2-oxoglutarate dehydrogenase complex dihydrolipoamide acyltransferase (E2) component
MPPERHPLQQLKHSQKRYRPGSVSGTGKDGRITKEDAQKAEVPTVQTPLQLKLQKPHLQQSLLRHFPEQNALRK